MHYNHPGSGMPHGGHGGGGGQQHPNQQYNHMARGGRGGRHNAAGGHAERRELRRPHQQHPQQQQMGTEGMIRGMQQMDPFGNNHSMGGYGGNPAQPAANADGWSSGENSYEQQQQQLYHHNNMMQHQQQQHHQQQQYQHHQQAQQQYMPRQHYRPPRNQYVDYNQGQQAAFNPRAHSFVPTPMNNRASAGLSASAVEFVPGGAQQFGGGGAGGFPGGSLPGAGGFSWQTITDESAAAMDIESTLKEAVTTLSQNADLLEDVEKGVVQIVNATIKDDESAIKSFVDAAIAKCLKDVSFLSPGAQLLGRLATSLSLPAYRSVLSARVAELRKTHLEAKDTEDLLCHAKLRTYATFTAELYLSLKKVPSSSEGASKKGKGKKDADAAASAEQEDEKSDGAKKDKNEEEGARDFALGEGLMEILKEMGQRNKDKENYKTISQAMKLAGHALESDEKAKTGDDSTPQLDAIMEMINHLGTDENNKSVSKYIKEMMTDVVALRKAGWGTKQIKIPAQYLNQAENNAASEEATAAIPQHHLPYGGMAPHEVPADYDFDGQYNGSNGDGSFDADASNFSAEELDFMNEQMGGGAEHASSEAPSDSEGGMNAEMEAAFEEFMLAQQKS